MILECNLHSVNGAPFEVKARVHSPEFTSKMQQKIPQKIGSE